MDIEELRELDEDLNNGEYLKSIIKNKIKEIEQPKQLRCNICHDFIAKNNPNAFSLEFGSIEDKKKAHFCKYDCLRYFLAILNKENG